MALNKRTWVVGLGLTNNRDGDKIMTEQLVTIGSYSTPYEANMVKSRLEATGIPAFVADEFTIGMNWLYSNALGGVKVQVPESLALDAQEILNSGVDSPTTDELATVDACPQCGSQNTESFLDKRVSFLTWIFLVFLCFCQGAKKSAVIVIICGVSLNKNMDYGALRRSQPLKVE